MYICGPVWPGAYLAVAAGQGADGDPPALYCTILCYTILCYAMLYCTILSYTILYHAILCYAMLHCTISCRPPGAPRDPACRRECREPGTS